MPSADIALKSLDDFLRTYPVRILKKEKTGGTIVDYLCPLAGIAILLTNHKGDDIRKRALAAEGLTVLTLHRTAIARNFDGICALVDDTIRHALTNKS